MLAQPMAWLCGRDYLFGRLMADGVFREHIFYNICSSVKSRYCHRSNMIQIGESVTIFQCGLFRLICTILFIHFCTICSVPVMFGLGAGLQFCFFRVIICFLYDSQRTNSFEVATSWNRIPVRSRAWFEKKSS